MSDTWYRDPPDLPPFEDGFGRLWTLDGRCPTPEPEGGLDLYYQWYYQWPEELRSVAFEASVVMDLYDRYDELMFGPSQVRGILASLAQGESPFDEGD